MFNVSFKNNLKNKYINVFIEWIINADLKIEKEKSGIIFYHYTEWDFFHMERSFGISTYLRYFMSVHFNRDFMLNYSVHTFTTKKGHLKKYMTRTIRIQHISMFD